MPGLDGLLDFRIVCVAPAVASEIVEERLDLRVLLVLEEGGEEGVGVEEALLALAVDFEDLLVLFAADTGGEGVSLLVLVHFHSNMVILATYFIL